MSQHTEAMEMRERGAGHTPGPWKIGPEPKPFDEGQNRVVWAYGDGFSPDTVKVATVHRADPAGGYGHHNVRLIAAVPDLLHAAKEVLHAITRTVDTYSGETDIASMHMLDDEVRWLREAIEKVGGGAS